MRVFFDGLAHQAATAESRQALISALGALTYSALVERVRAHAQWAVRLPRRVGLLFAKGPDQLIADLAMSFAGKELIPLPDFFSDSQLEHIVRTTQLSDVVTDSLSVERAKRLGLTVHDLAAESLPANVPAPDSQRIIFTSGTTGRPKGVCLSGRQLLASVSALAEASGAGKDDRYLSVLPGSLLLEQIAGTFLPLSVGAAIYMPSGGSPASLGSSLALAAQQTQATATVLVPELLIAWLHELRTHGLPAPKSFRFIAVGGAPVSQQLAATAWRQGLPVYEGYGLSECCSVVSVNRPDFPAARHGRTAAIRSWRYNRRRRNRRCWPDRDERLCRRATDAGAVAYRRSRLFRSG